jgi:hypothetical protein
MRIAAAFLSILCLAGAVHAAPETLDELLRQGVSSGRGRKAIAARARLAAFPRDGLSDDEWIDLHLVLSAIDRRLDPAPKREIPAGDAVALAGLVPDDSFWFVPPDATRLLDAAAAFRRSGYRAETFDLAGRAILFRAAERASVFAKLTDRYLSDEDPLIRAAAVVAREAAVDFGFDLRCRGMGLQPAGRESFEWTLSRSLSVSMTVEAALRWGRDAVREAEGALDRLAREIDPSADWRRLTERGRDDGPKTPDALFDIAKAATQDALEATVRSGLVTVPESARRPGVVLSAGFRPGFPTPYAHYRPGRIDRQGIYTGTVHFTRIPGLLPIESRTKRLRDRDRHWVRVIAAHEGVPGHHLQFAIAGTIRNPHRSLGYNSIYVEGWGLCSEDLAERAGAFPEPLTRLARHRMRLWRAVRVIIDVGMHTGTLTPGEAVRLLTDRVLLERSSAEGEIVRYLQSPTQPLSYLTGYRKIDAIRRAYLAVHGPAAEREFHDRFLATGPIPVDLAAAVLLGKRKAYDLSHP